MARYRGKTRLFQLIKNFKNSQKMEAERHYKQSRDNYDVKGESHIKYYMEKHPDKYKLLTNI